jgi:uncharacterized OsmC-like protein
MSEDSERIATAMKGAIEYLTAHPDEAAYTDSPAVAMWDKGLTFTVEGPAGTVITTDMPTGVGGGDAAPSPGWLFRAALATCEATLIVMRAAQEGVELAGLSVTVDSESNDYGILGIDAAVPAGPSSVRVRVAASGSGPTEQQLSDVVNWAHEHCPVADTVARAIPLTLELG